MNKFLCICVCLSLSFFLNAQDSWRHIKKTKEQLAKQSLHFEKGYLYGDSIQNNGDSACSFITYKKGKIIKREYFKGGKLESVIIYYRKKAERKKIYYFHDVNGRGLIKDVIEYKGFKIKRRTTYYSNGRKSKDFNRGNYTEWNEDGSKRKTQGDTIYIIGNRQNYEYLNSKKVLTGKPYLFSLQTMVNGKIISIQHFSSKPWITKAAWDYDSLGRLKREKDGPLIKNYFYKSDTDKIHSYTLKRIRNFEMSTKAQEFETVLCCRDSLKTCEVCPKEFTAKTGVIKVCSETSSSAKNNLVYWMVKYSYDSKSRMIGQGKYNEENVLRSYYTIEYDKNGNISKRTKWSFTGQDEERIDYIYDKHGEIKRAIGYYNNNATSTKESRFEIKYDKRSSNCILFISDFDL